MSSKVIYFCNNTLILCINFQICTLALHCCKVILKLDLPDLTEEKIGQFCSSILAILHKYSVVGLSKGPNFDLVASAFKAMSILVQDVKKFTVNEDQLKMLVIYIEQDMYDSDKKATAFRLLWAVLNRKLMIPEIPMLMLKIAELSITSEMDHVKEQSRKAIYAYLINYPVGKQIEKIIAFYANQLCFRLPPGRLSALDMMYTIITSFPEVIVFTIISFL